MSDTPSPPEMPDLQDMARRYLDLWQDHLNAVAQDKDTAETLARTMALMSSGAQAFADSAKGATARDDDTSEPGANSGTTPSTDASGGSDPRFDEFARRLAAIEERLAKLESGP